jgi:hypothetical protein
MACPLPGKMADDNMASSGLLVAGSNMDFDSEILEIFLGKKLVSKLDV